MKIFCVIPAYNEKETIVKVLKEVKKFISNIIVVDDGSGDNTSKLAKHEGVIVLRHIINRGQGAALRTGTEFALLYGAEVVIHFDADGQFMAKEILNVLQPIKTGEADVVFGSRFLGKKSNMPLFKKAVIMPLGRIVNKLFLGINLTDPQSGFRALSRKAATEIKIEQSGMAHCSEILRKVIVLKYKIKEVPITVIYYDFGQKFSGGVKILKELFFGRLIN